MIPGLGRSPGEGNGLPTPVFWPGEFHGLYNPWGRKELDTTEQLSFSLFSEAEHLIKVNWEQVQLRLPLARDKLCLICSGKISL